MTTDRRTISRVELQQKIDAGEDFLLFEVLPEPYYRKHHLPRARHMPPTEVAETAAKLAPAKDAEIVLYCWDDH
ncbi:MAG TPA: rhodanese-like domain-containing protein [Gemmatimonadaceae bacterium]|nr:rhodanese-like domain-containing protein [Gemmatimonadaceae bacterium]